MPLDYAWLTAPDMSAVTHPSPTVAARGPAASDMESQDAMEPSELYSVLSQREGIINFGDVTVNVLDAIELQM